MLKVWKMKHFLLGLGAKREFLPPEIKVECEKGSLFKLKRNSIHLIKFPWELRFIDDDSKGKQKQ